MASISVGGHGGKRAVDHEIPLVPFIDLLLCCIMFLLVAAVWNQMASMEATLPEEASRLDAPTMPESDTPPLVVRITAQAVVVGTRDGVRTDVASHEGVIDGEGLLAAVAPYEHDRSVIVSADDGISYARVIEAMDVLARAGMTQLTIGDASL